MSCPTVNELPSPPSGKIGWPWTEGAPPLSVLMPDGLPWPRVSVVTPSFNQAQFLEETIRSVLLQGYPNLEYFVMDGGSTDGSAQIIRKYAPWLAEWVSEKDKGQSDAINKGLSRASGSILAWLNSDDVYLPGCVSEIVSAFNRFADAGMIYGNIAVIDEDSKKLAVLPHQTWAFSHQLTQKIIISQQGAFWRRVVMDSIGMLRDDLHYTMDFEFWIRIGRRYKIVGLNCVLAQYRISSVSKTETQFAGWGPEFIKILDDLYAEAELAPEIVSLRRKAYANAYYGGARGFLIPDALKARVWLWKAVSYDPYIIFLTGWWQMYVRTLLGRRIYGWCRLVMRKLRRSR